MRRIAAPGRARHGARRGKPGDTSEFEFGLDLLLDGLERMRAVT